jgi:hypothetical protein
MKNKYKYRMILKKLRYGFTQNVTMKGHQIFPNKQQIFKKEEAD